MAKLTATDLTSLTNESTAISQINANFAAVETAMEKTLSRDGTTPNTMSASLDMNSQAIVNLPTPSAGTNPVTKTYGDANYGGTAATTATTKASEASASATAAASSASTASGHKDTALAQATLATNYAVKVDGAASGSDHSAKAWAIGGTGVTDTASKGAAKEWAIEVEDNTVDGSGYSALHWAAKASASATSASTSASTATAFNKRWTEVTLHTGATLNLARADVGTYYVLDTSSNGITVNLPNIGSDSDEALDGQMFGFELSDATNPVTITRGGDNNDYMNGVNTANYTGLTTVGQVIHFIADDASPDNWLVTIMSQSSDASATVKGIVELATDAEAITGTDTTRATTPANVAATFPTIRQIPQNSKSAAYDIVLTDAGKHLYHPGSDTDARTWTIPANSSIAFPIGSAITFVNDTSAGAITIAITSDVLVLSPDGTTGSRTLAANGIATCIKMTATRWMISGSGLT